MGTIFTGLRFFARLRIFKRLYLDDAFVFIAWAILAAMAILWQAITADDLYFVNHFMLLVKDYILGNDISQDDLLAFQSLPAHIDRFYKTHTALLFLFFTTLWCIKLSFLFFFRRLYLNMGKLLWIWWAISIFTIAAWVCCVGTIDYRCYSNGLIYVAQHCITTESYNLQSANFFGSCILDILTDIASKQKHQTSSKIPESQMR